MRPLLLFLLCLLPGAVSAQEARVRASMAASDTLYAGQRATMVVELLAPGFFAGAPSFLMPDPPGLILIPPTGSPVVSSETIDDISYTVQRHEVAVLAERAGDFTIPPIRVRLLFKRQPLDKEPVAATVTTPAVHFSATLPPGAEKLGHVISARDLKVTEQWKPEPGAAPVKAGDAFTRTIIYTAPDVPGMMFPPFPTGKIDGLGIYPKKPEVHDKSERGTVTGERRDTFTYACQQAGRFTIPAARLTWFDLEAKKLQTIDFPARTFDVAPNPALSSGAAVVASRAAPRWKIPAIVTALTLAALWLFRARLRRAITDFVTPLRPVHLQPLNPYSTNNPNPKTTL